jgi:hypothetical protein
MPQHKGGKKDRKFHRNEAKCKQYRLVRATPNKLRKLTRHLALHPNDHNAEAALGRLSA